MSGSIDRGARPDDWPDAAQELPVKALTWQEASDLRAREPSVAPWRVVAAQAVAGMLCAASAWLFTQDGSVAWSAFYGAAAVALPGALLARGMTRGARNSVAAALAGFMFWEFVKIATAVAMLAAAVKVVPDLSWPALLVTMIVCLKVNWFMLLRQSGLAVTKIKQKRV